MIVAVSLHPHPRRRIVVPVATGIQNPAQRHFDIIPAPFIVKPTSYEFGHEGLRLRQPAGRSKYTTTASGNAICILIGHD